MFGLLVVSFQNCSQGDYSLTSKSPDISSQSEDVNAIERTPADAPVTNTQPPIVPPPPILVEKASTMKISNEVDILVVIDDSGSMGEEHAQFSTKFQNFISNLTDMSWRVALTTTSITVPGSTSISVVSSGDLAYLNNQKYIDNLTPDAQQIYSQTVLSLGTKGSGQERGIYASNLSIKNHSTEWMRNSAHLAVIVVTDEDENSNGTNLAQLDKPESFAATIKESLGELKTYSFHSIIKIPGDTSCTTAAAYGNTYAALSKLTNGAVASVCSADYGTILQEIGRKISVNAGAIALECVPSGGVVSSIIVNGQEKNDLTYVIKEKQLYFDAKFNIGDSIEVKYKCLQN